MTREQRLKHEANVAATLGRGHDLPRFRTVAYKNGKPAIFSAQCRTCRAYVQVKLAPAANEVEIGGTAVALNCDRKE